MNNKIAYDVMSASYFRRSYEQEAFATEFKSSLIIACLHSLLIVVSICIMMRVTLEKSIELTNTLIYLVEVF